MAQDDKDNNTDSVELDKPKSGDQEEEDFDVVEAGSEKNKSNQEDDEGDDAGDEGEEDTRLTSEGIRQQDRSDKLSSSEKRKQRKKRLKDKLDAKDALIRSQQTQLRQLNDRLSVQERRTGVHERAMLDKALDDAKNNLAGARSAYAQSLTTGDPNAVAEANDLMYTARRRVEDLEGTIRMVNNTPQSTGAQQLDPSTSRNVNAFLARNSWYKPDSGQRDSRIVKVIDDEVAAEGFDPATPEYWGELERRLREALPHRYRGKNRADDDYDDDEDDVDDTLQQNQNQQRKQTNSQPKQRVTSSSQSSGGNGRIKVTLSAERIQAIKDAGAWDNKVERNKMIREYLKWDRDNAA